MRRGGSRLGTSLAGALAKHGGTCPAGPVSQHDRSGSELRVPIPLPEAPGGIGVTTTLRGPERVLRFRVAKRVANAGVVITQRGPGSHVEPRIVAGLDENRLTGYAGLPVNHNPYMDEFREPVLAAGVLSPLPGEYAAVFDSAAVPARERSPSATGSTT